MREADKDKMTEETAPDGGDLTLDLNFVPQWARRPPDELRFARFDDAEHSPRRGGSGGGNGGRGGRDAGRDDRRGDRRPARRPDDDSRRRPGRPGEPPARPGEAAHGGVPPRRDDGGRAAADAASRPADRTLASRPERRGAQPPEPAVETLPLSVRFLPEQKALSDLIRRVSSSLRAYPLLDLASLLMSKEGLCYVKLDVIPGAKDFRLYQCKHCGTLARSREAIEEHVVETHVDLVFDVQEEQVEPPSGVFVCVAKCGYSGVLLGPSNHHSYAEAVKRLHAERFATMDFEVYRRHIQTSHDAADVERWKQEASKRVVYRLKGQGGEGEQTAEAMTWIDAQRHMRTLVAPAAVESSRRVALPEKVAHEVRDPAIRRMLREEWQQESRFPIHLAFALRAAFRHRGLHLFKTGGSHGKGMNFVTAVKPAPLDPETAIPAIRDALLFMKAHPGCSRKDMVEALRPGDEPDSDAVKALLQPIHWLVEKGHVIEFFNGTLSVPYSR
jgi:hypothetical protein